jgi:hypothetical protein
MLLVGVAPFLWAGPPQQAALTAAEQSPEEFEQLETDATGGFSKSGLPPPLLSLLAPVKNSYRRKPRKRRWAPILPFLRLLLLNLFNSSQELKRERGRHRPRTFVVKIV